MNSLRQLAALLACVLGLSAAVSAAPKIKFNRDIRPILSENCYYCHGPDPKHREAKLRLDDRDAALAKEAFVPGKPDESELITRITTKDEDDLMPPPETHKVLKPAQIELLKRWIAEGAEYEAHWAYTPLVRPTTPKIDKAPTAIDRFIRATLAEKNIQPSEQADPRTLIRRVSLDVTGLPPSVAEVTAFVKAWETDREKAYEQVVDRLLASPHYGERMAAWWLDVARFADTVGFHGDQNQRIFPYRDYVIDAFATNKRFDQFTLEQLAGDLLPNPTPQQLTATGFNRLNMMTREGGAQPKEYLAKYGGERVRTVAGAWLGATFTCAECHDHKYDPITQRDFYSLQAFFADVKQWGVYADYGYTPNPDLKGWTNDHPFPPEIEVESVYLKQRIERLQKQRAQAVCQTSEALDMDLNSKAAFEAWLTNSKSFLAQHSDGWQTIAPEVTITPASPPKGKEAKAAAKAATKVAPKSSAPEKPKFAVQADGRVLFEPAGADNTELRVRLPVGGIAAVKLELLPDAKHKDGILRGGAQAAALLKVSASFQPKGGKAIPAGFRFADADLKDVRFADGDEVIGITTGWKTSATKWNEAHTSIWWLDQPIKAAEGDVLKLRIDGNLAGCVRVSVSPFAPPDMVSASKWMTSLPKLLTNIEPQARVAYLTSTAWNPDALKTYKKITRDILECRDGRTHTMVTQRMQPLTIRVLARGNWQDESGAVTPPATPHFLPGKTATPSETLTRLDLAKWLCSKENPVTPRAVMNRLWKPFFGNGLSAQVDDLGAQGEPPSHPELLDWLAAEFRDSGWDVRHMIKLIVMSATYRQDSNLRSDLRDADPNNRLLASQNPRRLDAEFVRDNALSIAGLLNLDIGGPSAKPYQPADYYANLQFPNRDYLADTDDRQWRRGLYMHWQRTFLHPMLANFDAPNRDECVCARNVSNTPQQALTLLNDPSFVEAARVFASRLLNECKTTDADRIQHAYQIALSRLPKEKEMQSLLAFLATQRKQFADGSSDPDKLMQVGLTKTPSDNAKELAAWTSVARVVLNLHETMTRY